MMNKLTITMLAAAAFTTAASAQNPNYLLTYSEPENTVSGSGGTVLGNLLPNSVPAFPFSLSCFPDLYTPTIPPWLPVGPGFGSFPMVGIPPAWSGKVLYQGVGFGPGTFELSTPTVIDVL